jgi:PAS domain-containing protein
VTVGCVRRIDGSIDYFVAVIEDIAARKRADEELAKSEERLGTLILHSPMLVFVCDDREQILIINQAWLQQRGHSMNELRTLEEALFATNDLLW